MINENINNAIPIISKITALFPAPFHSFKTMPHTLLKTTFNDIRILHENAIITLFGSKKLCPIPKPKNCEYHSNPAKAQNKTLFVNTDADELLISPPVLFFRFIIRQYIMLVINPPSVTRSVTGF